MNRKEEREAAAKNKYPYIKGLPQNSSHQSIFIEATEWADATMLDRVCEWLKSFLEGTMGEGLAKSITEEFRKAMEK